MRFAIAHHTEEKKRFLIVAEMVGADEDFELWKISPKDAPEKGVLVQSDRPKKLKVSPTAERFNWTKNGEPLTEGHLYQILRTVEWRIFFTLHAGQYGFNPKDAFELP